MTNKTDRGKKKRNPNYSQHSSKNKSQKDQSIANNRFIFRNDQGHWRRDCLVKEAMDEAKNMDSGGVSLTQLRKFYSEVLVIKNILKKEEKKIEAVEPNIAMLVSKAHYRKLREKKNTSLYVFIQRAVKSIKDIQNFEDFTLFFEAVIGFFPRKN